MQGHSRTYARTHACFFPFVVEAAGFIFTVSKRGSVNEKTLMHSLVSYPLDRGTRHGANGQREGQIKDGGENHAAATKKEIGSSFAEGGNVHRLM